MKQRIHIFFSFILLISFSWQCAAKSIIYISFKNNQKQLAETVCENKNKPNSCCAAKCYLDKEIKKEEKRQSDSSSSIKDKAEKTELRTGFITFLFTPLVLSNDYKMISVESLPNHFLTSVFHPPAL
ncbi:MAG: hypothetical protein U0W65_14330 [Bacteroidia bacterium]